MYLLAFLLEIIGMIVSPEQSVQLVVPMGHTEKITVDSSPDVKVLATASDDGSAKLWETSSGKMLYSIDTADSYGIDQIEFSDNGKYFFTSGLEKVRVWDAAQGTLISEFAPKTFVLKCAFHPRAEKVAVLMGNDSVSIIDFHGSVQTIPVANVKTISFSPDGKSFATLSDTGLQIWDANTLRKRWTTTADYFTFSSDSRFVYTSTSGRLTRRNVTTGKSLWESQLAGPVDYMKSVSRNGVIAILSEGIINLLGGDQGKIIHSLSHTTIDGSSINDLAVSDNGSAMVTVSKSAVVVWDMRTFKRMYTMRYASSFENVHLTSNAEFLVISDGASANVIDLKTGKSRYQLMANMSPLKFAKLSDDRAFIFCATDHLLQIVDTRSAEIAYKLNTRERTIDAYFLDSFLVTQSIEGLTVFDSSGNRLRTIKGFGGARSGTIVLQHMDDSLVTTSVTSGRVLHAMKILTEDEAKELAINKAVLHPDQERALGTLRGWRKNIKNSGTIYIWNLRSKKLINSWLAHADKILSIAISNNGKLLATSSFDGYVKIWNIDSGTLVTETKCNGLPFNLCFSSDDRFLAIHSNGPVVALFEIQTSKSTVVKGRLSHFTDDSKYAIVENEHKATSVDLRTKLQHKIASANGFGTLIVEMIHSKVHVFNSRTGEHVLTWVFISADNYIVHDNLGRFDGTPEAVRSVRFRRNGFTFDDDKMKKQLWVPGLAKAILEKNS